MDFYFDIGLAVILRIIKDRRSVAKYYDALAKLHQKLDELKTLDQRYAEILAKREAGR